MITRNFRPRSAFTLIELLTVIAIIGILAGMIIGVTQMVKAQARISATKQMFSQWASAVEQYKSTYGQYPYLNNQYETSRDTIINLNSPATVSEFVKCLSGRQPIYDGGEPLSDSDRKKFNKQTKNFCSFDALAFQKTNGNYTKLLTDSFDNTAITLIMDTDGNGMVKPVDKMPEDSVDQQGNVAHPVIIYTLKSTASNPTEAKDILSWQ